MRIVWSAFQRLVWIVTFLIIHALTRIEVKNKSYLHSIRTPLLIVANHRSYWDPMFIGILFPFFSKYIPMGFMAADEYFRNPLLRVFFFLTGTEPTYKGRGMNTSLRYPRKTLMDGGVFVIFPYGQRVEDPPYPRPGRGAAVLVHETTGLNILPINFRTTPRISVWNLLISRQKVEVIIGKPYVVENASKLNADEISKIIVQSIDQAV